MLRTRLALLLIFIPVFCWAQLVRMPVTRPSFEPKKKNPSARTTSLTAVNLPFWDDFSFNNSKYYLNDTLWENSNSVWVNTGMGINTPTLKVATFDGLDSLGKPYNTIDMNAKGYADKMISRPMRTDLITGSRRDSAYIFFMYEYAGYGESPDPGDELSLWLKDNYNRWTNIWSITYDSLSSDSVFIPVKIPFPADHDSTTYFFDNFQIQFRNFGRLTGPFDGWNLDYVYVSNGRKQYSPIYSDFPDRAIVTPMSSLFKQYRSIPAKHFLADPASLLTNPSFVARNMRFDFLQPVNYNSRYKLTSRLNKVVTASDTITLDVGAGGNGIGPGSSKSFSLNNLPDVSGVDPASDSVAIRVEIKLNSGDDQDKQTVWDPNISKLITKGDHDSTVYKNIHFSYNDTTATNFILKDYYAYDDGDAEYAASLTTPGSRALYRYDLKYSQPDTLKAVDIYFTHSGDESSQVIKLLVMDSLRDDVTAFYLPQDVVVNRTERNKFTRITLSPAVLVSDHFYIGWQQSTAVLVGIGLDYSSDSGGKISVNFGGAWQPNQDVHGNLMIRPVFGNAPLIVTAIDAEKTIHAYPNPNKGSFTVDGNPSHLMITDIAGRQISFSQENDLEKTTIQILTANPGMYVLRFFDGAYWRTEKIMVLP